MSSKKGYNVNKVNFLLPTGSKAGTPFRTGRGSGGCIPHQKYTEQTRLLL